MDSFTDDSTLAVAGSTGTAVRKRNQHASKSEAEKEKPLSKEKEIALAGIECAMERLKKPPPATDEFHVFGMYVASELRSLKDPVYAKASQRKMNRLLLDIMDSATVLDLLCCFIHSFTDINYYQYRLFNLLTSLWVQMECFRCLTQTYCLYVNAMRMSSQIINQAFFVHLYDRFSFFGITY